MDDAKQDPQSSGDASDAPSQPTSKQADRVLEIRKSSDGIVLKPQDDPGSNPFQQEMQQMDKPQEAPAPPPPPDDSGGGSTDSDD